MTKNAILFAIGALSLGILLGGSMGLPLGLIVGNRIGKTSIDEGVSKKLSRADFTKATAGKMKDEIIQAVGKPDRTSSDGSYESWFYSNRTYDPTTGRTDFMTIIHLGWGRFNSVTFQ